MLSDKVDDKRKRDSHSLPWLPFVNRNNENKT